MDADLSEKPAEPGSIGQSRRALAYAFYPGRKTFQIVVELKDVPGALADVLQVLRKRVNMMAMEAHRSEDGKAVFSCFAEPLRPADDSVDLEKLVRSSRTATQVKVMGSKDGLLVDSFFKGITTENGDPMTLFSWESFNRMFDGMVEVFGSGGEVMLYDAGVSIGGSYAKEVVRMIGRDAAIRDMTTVLKIFTAMGLGDATMEVSGPSWVPTIRIDGCFECSSERETRRNCSFVRGILTGATEAFVGRKAAYEETRCRFRGDGRCEFSPVPGKGRPDAGTRLKAP